MESQNPSFDEILKAVLADEEQYGTPILTNAVSFENKILIKIDKALSLQWLAENAKTPGLQCLQVQPIRIAARTNIEGRPLRLFCAVKLFLDGVRRSKGKSVSIATSFSHENENVLSNTENRKTLRVYVLLKPARKDSELPIYIKSYKMAMVNDIEVYKGLHDFVARKNLNKFIQENGSLIIGISVIVDG